MTRRTSSRATCNLAASYALGTLDADETRCFAQHLEAGCPACAGEVAALGRVAGDLALAARPATPPAALRARVVARAAAEAAERFRFQMAGEGTWSDVQPGVRRRALGDRAYLVRLDAGARVATHRHADDEHCYVLEGDLRIAGRHLHAGDYHLAVAGSEHATPSSDGGCLLLIVESPAAP